MNELTLAPDVESRRRSRRSVLPLFLNRWSPRAFLSEPVDVEDLLACVEAAGWAPSSFNEQPWRYVYATAPEDLRRFAECLAPFNRVWAATAPALVCLCARKRFSHDESENRWSAFDAGASWALFALEATRRGLSAHAMAGFDAGITVDRLSIPDTYEPLCFIALGRRGDPASLPADLAAREAPSGRKETEAVAFRSRFTSRP